MMRTFIKNTPGFFLIYDINKKQSFNNLLYWLDEIRDFNNREYKVLLIGNKNDLEREIDQSEGREFAKDRGFDFLEVRCKNDKDFDEPIRNFLLKF